MRCLFSFACVALMLCSRATADTPTFCSSPCIAQYSGSGKVVYIRTTLGVATVHMHASRDIPSRNVPFRLSYPLEYGEADYEVSIPEYDTSARLLPTFNPYVQAAEFEYPMRLAFAENMTLVLRSKGARRVLAKLVLGPEEETMTALEILTLPITMYHVHGGWWTRTETWWIFGSVSFALATLYIAFGRTPTWETALIYATSAFVGVCAEKLYHSILAGSQVSFASSFLFSTLVVTGCAEGLPIVFCIFFIARGRYRPYPWSVLALAFAVGSLFFAGSGWFVGPSLIALASVARLVRRGGGCAL